MERRRRCSTFCSILRKPHDDPAFGSDGMRHVGKWRLRFVTGHRSHTITSKGARGWFMCARTKL